MNKKPTPFQSVLIANRGEIACRIIRSAKALGLRTIAVYSDADADAPHVTMADEAVLLGAAPAQDSYLNATRILDAARASNAGAIHPGYGFLSENAGFAGACAKAGFIFIGPGAEAIDLMGDKAKAKRAMIKANIPCIPGYQGEDQSDTALAEAAKDIGFPLMVKAAAGGGGRGMRLVEDKTNLASAIKTARSEAENAFGDGALILERALINPRHVEIQILADNHGHVVHLGERDCSVQRRHQKVLEEAPAPGMTSALRDAMGGAAIKAAQDINYVGAGTVEFLLDSACEFYFLEMNTRLQVEHPVTEMVTGLDLVALQIRIAQGHELDFTQDDIALEGHAIEARLYAEDTHQDFLPCTGPIDLWHPAVGGGVRIDTGIKTGSVVSPFYDPMLAKIIAHGATREEARCRLVQALGETALFGVKTNKSFLIDALEQSEFVNGQASTGFIAQNFTEACFAPEALRLEDAAVASVLFYVCARSQALARSLFLAPPLMGWTSATSIAAPYRFADNDACLDLTVTPVGADRYQICSGGDVFALKVLRIADHHASLDLNGTRKDILFHQPQNDATGSQLQLSIDGRDLSVQNIHVVPAQMQEGAASAGTITTPMHGKLIEVFVTPGDTVSKGDRLAILEAMKMQHELTADIDGQIEAIHFAPGVQIAANTLLLEIKA